METRSKSIFLKYDSYETRSRAVPGFQERNGIL